MLMIAIMGTVNATLADDITVGDVSNSDCSQITRAESVVGHAMLKLTRSEIGLVGELRNFRVNCGYGDVNVFCEEDGQSLTIVIDDGAGEHMMDCSCPINIYFTLFNVTQDEFQLKLRGMSERNVGTISFKGHTMVEIDLTTKEILYDESFEYHLKVQSFRASNISDYENPKDVSQRLSINHVSETDFTCAYKKYVLPLDYSYLDVNATLDDDSTLVINVLTDGIPDKNGKRTCELLFNIVNSFRDAYHLRVNQTILLGSENEQTTCIYEGNITVPLHEGAIIPLAPTSTGFYVEPLWYYVDLFTKTASVQPSDTYKSLSNIVIIPSIELWGINCTVDKIGDSAFGNLTDLESITIPENVREIGQEAFLDCTGLTSVSFPSSLISIGDNSFRNCKGLTSVTLPDGLTSIGHRAFYNCLNLKKVDIPASVTNIDDDAFAFCQNLEDVYCRATTPPYTKNSRQFRKGNPEATLHVPAASLQVYKATAPWRDFKYIVPIETTDGYRPFIEDGKVWTYHYYNDFTGKEFYESLTVSGDTVINNKSYKKIVDVATGRVYCALREEGRKVYANYPNYSGENLIYDFGLNLGDTFPLYEGSDPWATVVSVDTIVVGDRSFRALDVRPNDEKEWPNWWVEGIGGMYHLASNFLKVGNFYYFSSCQLDGDTLFTSRDFQTLGTIPSIEPQTSMLCDGRSWKYEYSKTDWQSLTEEQILNGDYLNMERVTYSYWLRVEGDELFDGRQCKKIVYDGYNGTGLYGYGYEEDGRVMVYVLLNEPAFYAPFPTKQWVMLYDFNAAKDSHCNMGAFGSRDLIVSVEGTLKVDDTDKRYIGLSDAQHPTWPLRYAVDGIGCPSGLYEFENIITDGSSSRFVGCYDGDVCIFSAEDFKALTTPTDDCLPFVELGKNWHVVSSTFPQEEIKEWDYCIQQVKEEEANIEGKPEGHTYMKFADFLIREENHKVYLYHPYINVEFLMFDFSLKEGDTYKTYSDSEQEMVTYKVLSVGDYTEGPTITRYEYDEKADSVIEHQRYLRKWNVCRADNGGYHKTWIEGVGSLEGPFGNIFDERANTLGYLAYVLYNGQHDYYLPFSFYDDLNEGLVWNRGCKLPTGKTGNRDEQIDQLTYELEGDRLHVYGDVFTNCGPNHYIYFFEKPTDKPFVHELRYRILDVEPIATCAFLHATDFYVSGFDQSLNYIVVDNQGVEHPVINKNQQPAYRPFVEDDKVWKVGYSDSGNPVKRIQYYYFDGDTIIDGRICKKMMCQQYVNPDYPGHDYSLYMGAWYEEDKKVYWTKGEESEIMYDFSLAANAPLPPSHYVLGPRQTGGLDGFKGVYRDVIVPEEEGPNGHVTSWLEGVGDLNGPFVQFYNTYIVQQQPPFLMSCTVGDEVIYLNDEYEDGATPEGARKSRFDFTHTIKIKPKAPMMRSNDISSVYGEYNDLQLGINLNPLDEAYQVRITNESGQVVYEKTVNAGSIVALSIDISAYPKGRYTVTVENSNEAFTGEFETQTSGISDAARLNDKGKRINDKHIYNLQGIRVKNATKGIYIINGKKVVK